jgi:hypothetical protein
VFTNRIAQELGSEAAKNAAALVKRAIGMPADAPERLHMVSALVVSLRGVWWDVLALTSFMFVLTFLTRDFSLKVEGNSEHTQIDDEYKNTCGQEQHVADASLKGTTDV